MNDLDERITRTLHERAPVFVRPMPTRTAARVRARQAMRSLFALALVGALGAGTVTALSISGVITPASTETVPPPSGILPSPQGVDGGTNDSTSVSDPQAVPGEDTTAHGTNSTIPYTEQVVGQEAYLLSQKHVVAAGHVSGVEWSLAAYETRAYSGPDFARFLGGNCGDLMVGDQGEYGGITFCLHTAETAPDAAFAMAGFGNNLDGPITGYTGLVGDDVASVELRLSNGETTQLTLYDAPSFIDARYFETFVPAGASGRIVALGADGTPIDGGQLCVDAPPANATNTGCGHGLVDVSSVVTSLEPPPSPEG
jgi:hypothetical protein